MSGIYLEADATPPPPGKMGERRPCTKCGCPLIIVTGPNGKPIPLDARSPVYALTADLLGNEVCQSVEGYVSHFCTCPKADAFSKGRKR